MIHHSSQNNAFVILAAGLGSRMHSQRAKAMHTIAGKPMIGHIVEMLETAFSANKNNIFVVTHSFKEQIIDYFGDRITPVVQNAPQGTADAVHVALPYLKHFSNAVILYGDVPFVRAETIRALLRKQDFIDTMTILTNQVGDPTGYGRIIRNDEDVIVGIQEERDASLEERKIREVNTGIMAVSVEILHKYLPRIENHNAQQEYYLTTLVELLAKEEVIVLNVQAKDSEEVLGANNMLQLSHLEITYQARLRRQLLEQGLRLLDPDSVTIHGTIEHRSDCIVEPNAFFQGKNIMGEHVSIGTGSVVKDSIIGDHVTILPFSYIDSAVIEPHCVIGPYARLRPKTKLASDVRVGNFVEIKASQVGKGTKINHLSYIGDASIGEEANIGASTVICNYDGCQKHPTHIGNQAFVGSHSTLVAPVSVGEKVNVAAGTVVTKDTPDGGGLVISRPEEHFKPDWKAPCERINHKKRPKKQ